MSLVDCFAAFGLKNLRYPWSRLRRRLCERRYLKTELPPVNSLQDIRLKLKEVTWTKDGFFHLYDAISYPQTVWAKKKDDCDGFAILAAALLKSMDPATEPVLITAAMRPLRQSHTVCAFKDGQRLAFFNNKELCRGNFKEYKDIVAEFTKDPKKKGIKKVICWDVVKPETLKTLEFHRV